MILLSVTQIPLHHFYLIYAEVLDLQKYKCFLKLLDKYIWWMVWIMQYEDVLATAIES